MTNHPHEPEPPPGPVRRLDLWFHENQTADRRLGLRIRSVLREVETPYQHLALVETVECGKMLVLDGAIQLTEADEFMYHEMLVHPALFSLPESVYGKGIRALVVGGGDGGTAREILKHPGIERVDLVDIDREVFTTSLEHLPDLWKRKDGSRTDRDPRFHPHFEDGLSWAESRAREGARYDAILVDSTDPMPGPGSVLFSDRFYSALRALLPDHGTLVVQAGSPICQPEVTTRAAEGIARAMGSVACYLGAAPTYPSGLWCYAGAIRSGRFGPYVLKRESLERRFGEMARREGSPRYYTPAIHVASFALPAFVESLVAEATRPERSGSLG